MTELEQELLERVARLEGTLEELRHDIRTLEDKLNGYLENRVRGVVKAMVGEIFFAVLTSSAVISLLISFLLRR